MSVDAQSPLAGDTRRDFPPIYYAIIRVIDGFSKITGQLISLTMLFLVGSITYEVVARYFFRAPTIWVFESSTMANGSAFMLGCAYALYKGAHVRTDIFWDNYSERTKGIIDLISYLLLFFPVMITLMAISIDDAIHSYVTGERSQESLWRAIMWPFRAVIPLSALLFMIQGISEVLKCIYQIRFGREFVHREKLEV
jgi:TRAP-type mannitol/chloroaromatic compound transport system permease small subunit